MRMDVRGGSIPGHLGGAKDDLQPIPKPGPRVQTADLLIKFGHDRADHARRHALAAGDSDMAAARAVMEIEDGVLDEFAPLGAGYPWKAIATRSLH